MSRAHVVQSNRRDRAAHAHGQQVEDRLCSDRQRARQPRFGGKGFRFARRADDSAIVAVGA